MEEQYYVRSGNDVCFLGTWNEPITKADYHKLAKSIIESKISYEINEQCVKEL